MRNLILVRAAKGYTQEEMAEKIGVSKVAYASYEYGTREGTVRAWIKLEEILETPIREIYKNIPKPPRVRNNSDTAESKDKRDNDNDNNDKLNGEDKTEKPAEKSGKEQKYEREEREEKTKIKKSGKKSRKI